MSQQHRLFENNDDQPSLIDNDNDNQGNSQRAALRSSTLGPTEHLSQPFSSVISSSNDHVDHSSNPTGVGTPSVSGYTPSQSYPHQEFHTYADEQVYYGYGQYADGDSQETVMYMQSHSPPSRPAFFDDDEEDGQFVGAQAIVDDRYGPIPFLCLEPNPLPSYRTLTLVILIVFHPFITSLSLFNVYTSAQYHH